MSTKTKVVIAVRSDFERHHWWHPALGSWLLSLMYEPTYQVQVELVTGANGYSASANIAVATYLDRHPDAEWLCIVDNDTAPPADLLRILDDLPEHVDIISPVTHMLRDYGAFPQQGHYDPQIKNYHPIAVDPPGLVEVDRVGGGCWFIRKRVFHDMQAPYFRCLYDDAMQMLVVSDDTYFQERAKRLGFRLYCDSRYTASHYHTVDLSTHVTCPPLQ